MKKCFIGLIATVLTFIILLTASCERFPLPGEGYPGVPPGGELFRTGYPHAFVSVMSGRPVLLNGVNLRHAPYRKGGVWKTDELIQNELVPLGSPGAPAFNVVRIPMSWAYFQREDGTMVEEAFAELDQLIRAAGNRHMLTILDPIHINRMGNTFCNEDPVMQASFMNIPNWAWEEAGLTAIPPCGADENTISSDYKEKMLDVLRLQKTASYLKYILQRYDGATELGKWVVAVDLVNEPYAGSEGNADVMVNKLIDRVYAGWLDPNSSTYLRTGGSGKILIFSPPRGDMSLAEAASGLELLGQQDNILFTLHDYFGGALPDSSATYGWGYSPGGWPTKQKHSYSESFVYNTPFEQRYEEHRKYVQQYANWLHPHRIPLYIDEYGFNKKINTDVAQWRAYTGAARCVYDSVYVLTGGDTTWVQLPRTYWTHGQDDPMALWNKSAGQYYPHAWEATGENPPD